MNRGAWTFSVGGHTYVWAHGEVVHVFSSDAYLRRLSGEVRDASPFSVKPVPGGGFSSADLFEDWCRRERKTR